MQQHELKLPSRELCAGRTHRAVAGEEWGLWIDELTLTGGKGGKRVTQRCRGLGWSFASVRLFISHWCGEWGVCFPVLDEDNNIS